jgi:cytochrome c biogenesis protein
MATTAHSAARKLWQTLGAVKTGVILLILVVILSAAGTVILQRPTTDPDEMQRAYSPHILRMLDAIGLTDVFHAWWFVLLLTLVSLSIVAASIQRFPNSWRFFSRPYKSPDESFRNTTPNRALIPIQNEEAALSVAERVLRKDGFHPEHIVREKSFSLFGERNRLSEMAVYVVHASLLLIFLGGITDAVYGWRAYLTLTRGQESNLVEPQSGSQRALPFAIRCEDAGQENYADGMPKRWWSNLTVIENGQAVLHQQIVVNDPLVYKGVRFYQAGFGNTGNLDTLVLTATPRDGQPAKDITISPDQTVDLDADTTVRLAEFIPDYFLQGGQVYTRSHDLVNPIAHLVVASKKAGVAINYWLPPVEGLAQNASSPYTFQGKDIKMAYYTGLEVSHEPGQWGVWAGVVLMAVGLALVFYFVHMRVWAVTVHDARGQLMLWVGGTANKNKEVFEQRFRKLVEQIEAELKVPRKQRTENPVAALAGR